MENISISDKKFIDRLEEFMVFKGINRNQITVAANLSNGLIGKALKNRTSLNSDSIENILIAYPELNADWLMAGRGRMLMDAYHESTNNESLTLHLMAENNELKQKNESLNRELGRLEGQLSELKKHNALMEENVECADARKLISGE